MHNVTPVPALLGGLLIGIATLVYVMFTGRYAGLSGILRGAAFGEVNRSMDVLFTIGLVAGGASWFAWGMNPQNPPATMPLWPAAIGGIFVGFGTALARGCTSGHGVCGLGRLSGRSLAAVVTFVAAGIATVFVVRHLLVVV